MASCTVVHADTSSFQTLVQKLTGANDQSQKKFPITHRGSTRSTDHCKKMQKKSAPKNPIKSLRKNRSCTGRQSRSDRRNAGHDQKKGDVNVELEKKHKFDTLIRYSISSGMTWPSFCSLDMFQSFVSSVATANDSIESTHYGTTSISSSAVSLESASICEDEGRKSDGELKLLQLFPLQAGLHGD